MSDKEMILETLEEYADAYCAKDIDRLMAIFDGDEDISVIGTGTDELCSNRDAIRSLFLRNFADATATRFEWHWQHVTLAKDCAVVATTLTIHLETQSGRAEVPVRWTVVMAKKAGAWRWLHRHASAAASSQSAGTAYPSDGPQQ